MVTVIHVFYKYNLIFINSLYIFEYLLMAFIGRKIIFDIVIHKALSVLLSGEDKS